MKPKKYKVINGKHKGRTGVMVDNDGERAVIEFSPRESQEIMICDIDPLEKPIKTAFVLSGGGAKGAYQAKMIHNIMSEYGDKLDIIAVSGVSVGALNGAMLASGEIDRMMHLWDTVKAEDVYTKNSLFRVGWNYLKHKIGIGKTVKGLYDNSPLRKLIEDNIDIDKVLAGPQFTAGRVSINDGSYTATLSKENYVNEILASTAIPVVWDPVEGYVDGGVRNITPISDVLNAEPELVVIIPTQPMLAKTQYRSKDIVDIAQNSLDILLDEVFKNDIKTFTKINSIIGNNPNVYTGYKYYKSVVLSPTEKLGSALNFSNSGWLQANANTTWKQYYREKFREIINE